MSKTVNDSTEIRNNDALAQRVKKDLTWIVISLAVALAAATGTYMTLTK